MTVARMENEMSCHEYMQWAALQKLRNEQQERAEKRAKSKSTVRKRR